MADSQGTVVLKQDALGRVERVEGPQGAFVRRVACGGALPGSARIARLLLARERRALGAVAGLPGVARVLAAPSADVLERAWLPGRPLCEADALPSDFFERLEDLVRALHARGVCHNDLHKEGNVLVGADGRPALVDFQLASVHPRRGRRFGARAREDLRHVWKHRSVYLRATGRADPLAAAPPRRSWVARAWRRWGKPVYRILKRSGLGERHLAGGESRRPKAGPWPRWTPPVGPRESDA